MMQYMMVRVMKDINQEIRDKRNKMLTGKHGLVFVVNRCGCRVLFLCIQ